MSAETERLYWDNAAQDPDASVKYIADVDLEACLDGILPHLKPYSVLEIGCGIGRLTTAIDERHPDWQLHGIDISSEMLDLAPKTSVKYRTCNGRRIPYPDDSFDSVYSMLVFQHIPDEAKELYIKEARRVLKVGGILRVQYVEGDYHADIDHNTTETRMLYWLEESGFEVVSIDRALINPLWTWITAVNL